MRQQRHEMSVVVVAVVVVVNAKGSKCQRDCWAFGARRQQQQRPPLRTTIV